MNKKAILLGATGLIGQNLLQQLLASSNYSQVLVLVRKPLPQTHLKLKQLVVNFEELANYKEEIIGDVVFCCLGSTAKKTPDPDIYRKIDYHYPLVVAEIALSNGATSYHLVSSMGANPNASLFYAKTKGEVERDLQKLAYQTICIYRPSLLDGTRIEERSGENIMINVMRFINPILIGSLKKYRSIKIAVVATAMLKNSLNLPKGKFVYLSNEIEEMGG